MSDNPPPSHAQYFEQLLAMGTPPPFLEVPPPPTAPGPFPVDASETSPYTPRPMFDSTHPYPMALHINPTSDRTSDACSQTESQTPGGSTTSRHQHSTGNTRRKKPTTLSYYQSTEVHAPLAEAKESFAATSFASGCFFYHQRSRYIETFQTYARDAIAQAATAHGSKYLHLYYYYRCANLLYSAKMPLDKNIMTLVCTVCWYCVYFIFSKTLFRFITHLVHVAVHSKKKRG